MLFNWTRGAARRHTTAPIGAIGLTVVLFLEMIVDLTYSYNPEYVIWQLTILLTTSKCMLYNANTTYKVTNCFIAAYPAAINLRNWQWNDYYNWSTFAAVILKLKVAHFWRQCSYWSRCSGAREQQHGSGLITLQRVYRRLRCSGPATKYSLL